MNKTLKENIDWVGYVDWSVRDFHGYNTARGATYNSYLVRDEKTALIDAVKKPYAGYLLKNIKELTDPAKIDYIVANHAEPDHAGALPDVVAACPGATVICTQKCQDTLSSYHNTEGWNWKIVKSGDTVSLGKRTLTFIETPMVHWPESMFTYVPEEKLLFSMDAFGQHFSSAYRFDDEVDVDVVMEEAKKYYANIVMLYGKQTQKALAAAADLDIEMIAPAHGVIWRTNIGRIIAAYKEWTVCKPVPKVLVIYDTMWDSTKIMGEAIVDGAAENGVDAKLIYVRATGLTEIATEALDASAFAFGSSTLNQNMMPMMAATLTYLKGLRPAGKVALAFGSHGWGKGGSEAIHEFIQTMGVEILRDPVKSKWRPTAETLQECREAGKLLADRARKVCGG
jgi:flavorubredoxin